MREIKFRGLSFEGKWVYGDLVQNRLSNTILIEYKYNGKHHLTPIKPETAGEYTGLKDKNGTEIYEGDIVQRTSVMPGGFDFMGVVKYSECAFWIDNTETAIHLFEEIDDLKVVGNIYEAQEDTK